MSAISPPPGFSTGGALGMGVGLLLLGGSKAWRVGQMPHVVAWVPETLASSGEEASALAMKIFQDARKTLYTKGISVGSLHQLEIGKYPQNDTDSYLTFSDFWNKRPVPFTADASRSPQFLKSKKAYGPIFIRHVQFHEDGRLNDIGYREGMQLMSKNLPEWFRMYYPGLPQEETSPVVYSEGKALYFIGR